MAMLMTLCWGLQLSPSKLKVIILLNLKLKNSSFIYSVNNLQVCDHKHGAWLNELTERNLNA